MWYDRAPPHSEEETVEQGPEEVSDRPDERAEELEKVTDRPLDEPAKDGDAGEEASAEGLQAIDPGL